MRSVVILGSPRKNGNSATLANRAMEGINEAGGVYDSFYLNRMSIRPCQACEYCRRSNVGQCAIRDDMQTIYDQLAAADSLLLASPIYMFSVTAQLKLFLDRCYAVPHALQGKRIGIIITYGEKDEFSSGAINAIHALRDEYRYKQATILGIVHGSASTRGDVAQNAQLMDAAYQLGWALVKGI